MHQGSDEVGGGGDCVWKTRCRGCSRRRHIINTSGTKLQHCDAVHPWSTNWWWQLMIGAKISSYHLNAYAHRQTDAAPAGFKWTDAYDLKTIFNGKQSLHTTLWSFILKMVLFLYVRQSYTVYLLLTKHNTAKWHGRPYHGASLQQHCLSFKNTLL